MTGEFYLDWAVVAVSMLNATLLAWLGATVLLNAERRTWGIWLAGGGLLMGSGFFFSHSAILGHGLSYLGRGIDFWWRIGWILIIALPFAWYVIMMWYAGLWGDEIRLRELWRIRRQRRWLLFTAALLGGIVGLLGLTWSLPSFDQMMQLELTSPWPAESIYWLMAFYPLYIILCNSLSLRVLRHPGPTGRVMGDLARQRARPWLIATSLVLLWVSLLVAAVLGWTLLTLGQRPLSRLYSELTLTIAWFDLVIDALISVSVMLLGQAIVSYEVFTGKTLPRRGFQRYWYWAIILAAGYGALVGWALTLQLRPIYSFLMTTFLLVAFYGLLSWRSFAERERAIAGLRPFVASPRLYEHVLARSLATPFDIDVARPFYALCGDVLGARVAYLSARGSLAALVGPPWTYPPGRAGGDGLGWLSEVNARVATSDVSPQTLCIPLDPAGAGGAVWAVPLWSERGLIGVLLLGDKHDGGLYTQEEIEIARTIGERLIDTQATVEMARRLMALQRQQLAQSQVIDRRTRRTLHDEVLPRLHAAVLTLSSQDSPEAIALLSDVHRQISNLLRQAPSAAVTEVGQLGFLPALRHMVDQELGGAFDEVTWTIQPEAERRAQELPPLSAEVLFYATREAMRNAASHGRGGDAGRPLRVRLSITWREGLHVLIEDDGVGLRADRPSNGGGHGLFLHSTMMAIVGGSLETESQAGAYTRVRLILPTQQEPPGT